MRDPIPELKRRLALTESDRRMHAAATPSRAIEAAACEIRAQALREAIAICEGDPLDPNRTYQQRGVRAQRLT